MTAKITSVRLAAAHEGVAEMIVTVTFENGGATDVPLDRHASDALLRAANAQGLDDLVGQSWEAVRDALQTGFNRYEQGE